MNANTVPYLVREEKHGRWRGYQTVVWPTEPASYDGPDGPNMTCWGHNSGHGACSREWMVTQTRNAEPNEQTARYLDYAKRDMFWANVVQYKRIQRWMDRERERALAAMEVSE